MGFFSQKRRLPAIEIGKLGLPAEPGSGQAFDLSERKKVGSLPSADESIEMAGDPAPALGAQEGAANEMSDEQIEILALTVSNVSEVLNDVPEDLAKRVRDQQEDVADRRREAQVNEDLLRLRVR